MPHAPLDPTPRTGGPPDGRAGEGVHVPEAPVGSALLRLVRAHAQLGIALLAGIGVPPPQELILLRLEERGTLSQSDLVRYLNRDRSTTSTTLQAMERAGLIIRSPSRDDRRALDVSLTESGRALCPAVREAWTELEDTAFSHLSPDARAALIATLDAAREALAVSLEERASSRVR